MFSKDKSIVRKVLDAKPTMQEYLCGLGEADLKKIFFIIKSRHKSMITNDIKAFQLLTEPGYKIDLLIGDIIALEVEKLTDMVINLSLGPLKIELRNTTIGYINIGWQEDHKAPIVFFKLGEHTETIIIELSKLSDFSIRPILEKLIKSFNKQMIKYNYAVICSQHKNHPNVWIQLGPLEHCCCICASRITEEEIIICIATESGEEQYFHPKCLRLLTKHAETRSLDIFEKPKIKS